MVANSCSVNVVIVIKDTNVVDNNNIAMYNYFVVVT